MRPGFIVRFAALSKLLIPGGLTEIQRPKKREPEQRLAA